jgi:nickel transport protein
VLSTPPEDPAKTDKVEHLASLSFVLAHAPE